MDFASVCVLRTVVVLIRFVYYIYLYFILVTAFLKKRFLCIRRCTNVTRNCICSNCFDRDRYYYYYYYYYYYRISHFSDLAGKYSPILGFSN